MQYQQEKISSTGFNSYLTTVEVAFLTRDEFVFNLTICKKKKESIVMIHQEHDLSFDDCKKTLKKAGPFSLIITGKPVIQKKLTKGYGSNPELIQAILPDAKNTEFGAQLQEFKGMYFGALIRQNTLEKALAPFVEAKLLPFEIIIGPYLLNILPAISGKSTFRIVTSNYHVNFEDDLVSEISSAEKNEVHELPITPTEIQHTNMLGLCTCINAALGAVLFSPLDNETATKLMNEAHQKKRFRFFLMISVAVLALTVFTNFYFNQQFAKKHAQLEEQITLNKQAIQEMEKLEAEIAEKRSLIGNNTLSQGPVISIMADELAKSVPEKIRLTNMEFFPVDGKIQKEKLIAFANNKIIIEGISNETDVLDNWINQCKELKWVKDVLLVKYTFDNEQKKGYFKMEFTI